MHIYKFTAYDNCMFHCYTQQLEFACSLKILATTSLLTVHEECKQKENALRVITLTILFLQLPLKHTYLHAYICTYI